MFRGGAGALSRQQGGKPSSFPPQTPLSSRRSGTKTGQTCTAQTNQDLRRSTFSATPAEGVKSWRQKKIENKFYLSARLQLGDGLEHNSKEPHEVLTNGWMKKVPAESLIATVSFDLRWDADGMSLKMPTAHKCLYFVDLSCNLSLSPVMLRSRV